MIGIALATISVVTIMFRGGKLRGHGGAVVIIGPFPILFGNDKQSAKILMILAIILVVVLIGFFLLQFFF